MKVGGILTEIERLNAKIEEHDRDIERYGRLILFWRFLGLSPVFLGVIALLIRLLVIG